MRKPLFLVLILLAVAAVAIADIFLKKAAATGSMHDAIKTFWFWGAIALYIFQIVFFTYVFVMGFKLSLVGFLQTVFYALIVLSAGLIIFHEPISKIQAVGMAVGFAGVILMNL